ncbi:uncharacterized protein LOC129895813 isoform X2 [Solanum dulcamara]|uniref:uncharacterized protein LOC129895813 isoform X2 n=1 Tax=Solanum dulcamara TaxID=45834 RepID=UPI002486A08B|nr:uncharacterized protein LOC129895813 isoform X2 [Solanum dulcamara]
MRKNLLPTTLCRKDRFGTFFCLCSSVCRRGAQMATLYRMQKEPHNIHQAHMEKNCEICGDRGFQEAIITCYLCKNVDVHQYCVVGYCEDAPVDWSCEECDNGKGVMSSSCGLENEHSEGSKLHVYAEICHSTVRPKKHSKLPGRHGINWEKEVQTGKTRYLPVEEALSMSSGIKRYGSPLINTGSSRVVLTKSMATMTRGNFSKSRAHTSNSFPEKSTVQQSLGSAGYTKPQNLQNAKITEQSKKQGQSSKGLGGFAILEHRSPDAVNESRMMNPSMTHPCDSALVPSWKGCFDILGAPELAPGIFNNYIQAHPPSRVRRKVYEFSGLLPSTLKFELVPRGDIWASLFNNHCPGKEDIGLYFFASEGERSEIYIALVEFMRIKDLVMRTLINDVELLILPSTALSSDSQRWNSKHFLWGLFYRMGQDTDGCAEGGSNKVIDMEIEMIGGEDVCTANKVDMEAYHQNEVEMPIDMIGQKDVCTANKVDLEDYQNEVEMEIDMIAGENVGTLDIVVSTATRNGFDTSLKGTVTSATCNASESATPLVSRTSEGCKELLQVIKREPVDDFPTGFMPRLTPTK